VSSHTFPVHYRPRPYQAEIHKMWDAKRFGVAVLSRQAGKDVAMSIQMCKRRLEVPKTTGTYISLDNPMIRDILWDKTYYDPDTDAYVQMLQDNTPAELVTWKNTVMEGRFHNGSRLKLQGYFQAGRDKNGVGTSFQDYAFTELALFNREDPIPRLLPILTSTPDKKLMVVSTPRGKRRNPLWQLMESLRGNADYGEIIWGINDINDMMRRAGLPVVRTEEQLELDRASYRKRFGNDRMFNQEYHVDFGEMDAAAVYGEAYLQMVNEDRVQDFNLHPGHPVFVAFDIGSSGAQSDATSWIAFQWYNQKLMIFDCGEGHGRALPEYVDVLREKPWWSRIAQMILPWDGEHHEKAINATPADMMRLKFPNVAVLKKSSTVWKIPNARSRWGDEITDIQAVRLQMYNTIIHRSNCDWMLECFENFKYEYNQKLQEWTEKPLHDKYSHMMDALRYVVQATRELEFFGGELEVVGGSARSDSYEESWEGVW
jgi:phage terminase large subunit